MDIDKDELMASIKKELEPEITKISFDTWIAPLGIRSIEGNNIVFTTTSEFQRDFIENKYRPLIFNTLRFITNKDWTFSVIDLSKEQPEESSEVITDADDSNLQEIESNKSTLNPKSFLINNSTPFTSTFTSLSTDIESFLKV